jgi:hypothetical protein
LPCGSVRSAAWNGISVRSLLSLRIHRPGTPLAVQVQAPSCWAATQTVKWTHDQGHRKRTC